MRDSIARALCWVLCLLFPRPRPGRHSAAHFAFVQAESQVAARAALRDSPWRRAWTGPTKADVTSYFARHADCNSPDALAELRAIRERRRAAALATVGLDYPYTYPGAHTPPAAAPPRHRPTRREDSPEPAVSSGFR
ncbi:MULTISPECIES: hypothetical protein [Streptomyces]|uniref:Uncharacterized protein n=1 Tax=Streptomyces evansiae TaxID=3075535 RepID=A0ABU2R300_9ACTN|nr:MULTISPECIES: hypothetical protein [unclassified Streptomyces]MDT0411062.1 hypothetical protein [Streptomyces sp. DSM 41979]MYQ58090.1 hypothetical protein [Streptomyces sp. SID4926]SCD89986.1 hypothetical protein GA0115252_123735 [Streptomyces sp. DfronAA-171]